TLKGKLGEETFEAANKLFGKSALLDELFGATSKLTIEAKQSLSHLSDGVLRQVAGKGDAFAEQTAALIRKIGGAMEPDALARLAMEVDPKVLAMLERKYGGRALATLGNTFEPKTLKGLTEAELEGLGKTAQKNPEKFSRLNLGSGQNPMEGAINVDLKPAQGVDLVSDANKIGLKPGTQVEVHAVNPYGFNPVSKETARVMKPGGLLYVTGTERNPFAKVVSQQEALEAGFEIVETMSGIHPKHQFGAQALSNGNPLNTASSTTTIYRKLP
ncbi:MAG: hypothetical protein H6741_26610, partial [Alphaproteobacteria bacterium]|nr:hypothetical protein [Alphaproteobacteria bacterium]